MRRAFASSDAQVQARLLEVNDAAIAEEARQPNGSHRAGGNRHAYLFLLQLDTNLAFMGCSPEKLFKLEGDQSTTRAREIQAHRTNSAQLCARSR